MATTTFTPAGTVTEASTISNVSSIGESTISASIKPVNPWEGQFGTLQVFEVIFLVLLTVLGTVGNLVVIFSIALERRVHAHGNIFIINLAVADLMVTGFVVPTVIANVVNTGNALDDVTCKIVGFLVTVTCTCSLSNLMFIAINRYWAVVRSNTYVKTFTRKRVYYMVAFTWLWSVVLVSPTLPGLDWGGLAYDQSMMVCSWDDKKSLSFTIFITTCAIFIPLCIIGFCYFKLFSTVQSSGRWVRSLSVGSGISQNSEQHRRSMRKERSLLRTLATTVVLFCVSWLPFGFSVMISPRDTPPHAKKVFGWIALSNSCVNFIIYGAMNPVFRRGYHNLFLFIFRCKRAHKISSTMLHGSFSDSFKAVRRVVKSDERTNGKLRGSNYHTKIGSKDRDNSRADTITAVPTQTTLANNSPALAHANSDIIHKALVNPAPRQTGDAPVSQKRGIVDSLRRASLLRKARPKMNISNNVGEEEDRASRLKRNSAMLLQIQVGDEEFAFIDDEELAKNQDARFSRRAMSDVPVRSKRSETDEASDIRQFNDNSNLNRQSRNRIAPKENGYLYENIAINGPLRGSWMPEDTVYRSRNGTPTAGRSPTKKPYPQQNGIQNSTPTRKKRNNDVVSTVSGNLEPKDYPKKHTKEHRNAVKTKDYVPLKGETVTSKSAINAPDSNITLLLSSAPGCKRLGDDGIIATNPTQEKEFLLPSDVEEDTHIILRLSSSGLEN